MSVSWREFQAAGGPFRGYAYAYPHKTAYRPLTPPVPLAEAWAHEDRRRLFLYAHVPFCEKRCGFCNLFTTAQPGDGWVSRYLDALVLETETVAAALGPDRRVARLAVGGGTPTWLSPADLTRLLATLQRHFPGLEKNIPSTVETSPGTVTQENVALLRAQRITRVSVGVQSFLPEEVLALGRRQDPRAARQALQRLMAAGFDCVNVDLMYGMDGQNADSWRRSLAETVGFSPEEIYLYPLYVRPLTGLAGRTPGPEDLRLNLYRAGREFLLNRGYRQVSMRLFRRTAYRPPAEPEYCCQEDGMIGLGPGARSYTASLHYSTDYAVGATGVRAILEDYTRRDAAAFARADYGCRLDDREQRRRYVVKSLLRADGLERAAYQRRFGADVLRDLPELAALVEDGLAETPGAALRLNERGLELSDVIGPWLCSPAMRRRMAAFALR